MDLQPSEKLQQIITHYREEMRMLEEKWPHFSLPSFSEADNLFTLVNKREQAHKLIREGIEQNLRRFFLATIKLAVFALKQGTEPPVFSGEADNGTIMEDRERNYTRVKEAREKLEEIIASLADDLLA